MSLVRIGNTLPNRWDCGLVQHIVHAGTDLTDRILVQNVCLAKVDLINDPCNVLAPDG
jgi:hypothetical protein